MPFSILFLFLSQRKQHQTIFSPISLRENGISEQQCRVEVNFIFSYTQYSYFLIIFSGGFTAVEKCALEMGEYCCLWDIELTIQVEMELAVSVTE